jgi:hypothetical protein
MTAQIRNLTDPDYLAKLGRESGLACAERLLKLRAEGKVPDKDGPPVELSIPFNNAITELCLARKLDWNMSIDRQLIFIDAWFAAAKEKGLP